MSLKDSDIQIRPLWRKICPNGLILLGIVLLILTLFRAYGTIVGGPGQMTMLGFLLMWFVPLLFLTHQGRSDIGLTLPKGFGWGISAPLLGLMLALVCYWIGILFYDDSDQHWFQSVAATFLQDERVLQMPRNKLFWMFTIPAMIFSPIGEEILFRGCIQRVVQDRWGLIWGVGVSAFLFATVHLFHHGIALGEEGLKVFWISGFLRWVLMIVTSLGFSWLRIKYQSILPAIIGHSFYNLGMNYTIFYLLLS
jgi:uncharacterized protein